MELHYRKLERTEGDPKKPVHHYAEAPVWIRFDAVESIRHVDGLSQDRLREEGYATLIETRRTTYYVRETPEEIARLREAAERGERLLGDGGCPNAAP